MTTQDIYSSNSRQRVENAFGAIDDVIRWFEEQLEMADHLAQDGQYRAAARGCAAACELRVDSLRM